MTLSRFKYTFTPVDERAGALTESLPLLSVSQYRGVVPRAELAGDEGRAADLTNYKTCRAGDIVLNRMSAYNGAVGLAHQPGLVSPDYLVLRPQSQMVGRYMAYLIRSHWFIGEMTSRVKGIGSVDSGAVRTPRIGLPELGAIVVDVPESAEQRAIAEYLDRETVQIDAFIAKNEELIALLTERRAATTFRLVTGLEVTEVPPKAVMADWFRAVPQTWDVAPLYTMAKTFAGGTPKSDADEYWTDDDDNGVEWIAIGDMRAVQAGYPHNGRRVTAAGLEAAGLTPRSGPMVLFAMYASVGELAMLRRAAVWNQAILGIRANPSRLSERYLYWTLLALRPKLGIYFRSNTQDNLNAAQVRGLRLPVPPLSEQQAIADQLEETWAKVDKAIATAQRGVELARERRAALISAAVTGKIDVGVTA